MILDWFNARDAMEVGAGLAEQIATLLAPNPAEGARKPVQRNQRMTLQELLRRADLKARPLGLNLYKRAMLANSFKWRLTEIGVARELADVLSRKLAIHLSANQSSLAPQQDCAEPGREQDGGKVEALFAQAETHLAQGAHAKAVVALKAVVKLNGRHAAALNNLGVALFKLDRYEESERYLRQATAVKPDHYEANRNLGNVLRTRGLLEESEASLRLALRLQPTDADTRADLGWTLAHLGHARAAEACFRRVLKVAPGHVGALLGMTDSAKMRGRFEDADALIRRALKVEPRLPGAWAALVGTRRMTSSDGAWLQRAEEICADGISLLEQIDLRFAMGKFHDDVGAFEPAFRSYERANKLLKTISPRYNRRMRTQFVDHVIGTYTPESIARVAGGASDSMRPVIVVGMMRSGTSLAEQIIASHPSATGFGERDFWQRAVREHGAGNGLLNQSIRQELAESYLSTMDKYSNGASRVVDKAPYNVDYLGVIHSTFPNARIIYMQRDPIDACLSSYFQHFPGTVNFTMDLSDLAHYYREHSRLVAHWRAILPSGIILRVPYEELIDDQETWTRRILDFLGLEWDARCLKFEQTKRTVRTASYWQVRQPLYTRSVRRWRNYEKFIAPLIGLGDLA